LFPKRLRRNLEDIITAVVIVAKGVPMAEGTEEEETIEEDTTRI